MPPLLVAALLATAALQSAETVCTADQVREWKTIRDHQFGLVSRDEGHVIGAFANRKKASWLKEGAMGGRNWFPVSPEKVTACGSLEKLELFKTPLTGDEEDFHIFFADLFAPYRFLREEIGGLDAPSKPFYTELTFPVTLRSTPFWDVRDRPLKFKSQAVSAEVPLKVGSGICAYGPWVVEEFHENQPEIHPAEHFWFPDPRSSRTEAAESGLPRSRVWVAGLDVSNRFESPKYYCSVASHASACKDAAAPRGQPWSAESKTTITLLSAFEVRPGGAMPELWVSDLLADTATRPAAPAEPAAVGDVLFYADPGIFAPGAVTQPFACREGNRTIGYTQMKVQLDRSVSAKQGVALVLQDRSSYTQASVPLDKGGAAKPGVDSPLQEGRSDETTAQMPCSNGKLTARFRDLDDPKQEGGWIQAETDVTVEFEGADEKCGGVMQTALGQTPRREEVVPAYRKVFSGRAFGKPSVSARFVRSVDGVDAVGSESLEWMVLRDCPGFLRSGGGRVGEPGALELCLNDYKKHPYSESGEVIDVEIRRKGGVTGRLDLRATVTAPPWVAIDGQPPAGDSEMLAERTFYVGEDQQDFDRRVWGALANNGMGLSLSELQKFWAEPAKGSAGNGTNLTGLDPRTYTASPPSCDALLATFRTIRLTAGLILRDPRSDQDLQRLLRPLIPQLKLAKGCAQSPRESAAGAAR